MRNTTALLAVFMVAALASGSTPGKAAAGSGRIALGAYIPHAFEHPAMINRYGRLTGRSPVIVGAYQQWNRQPFVRSELRGVWSRGALPMITWEPWKLSGRAYPLRAIAAGRYDAYIRRAARTAAAWGHPILVRFAHEMNGNWYPWGRVPGNTPRIYKAAWRHVVRIFRRLGARNVLWVWSPNINNAGNFPFRQYYPGDAWVDWVGADGFNWGLRNDWTSFTQVFAKTYHVLTHISSRPVLICETGSSQRGGSKARWVRRALGREIPRFGRLRGVVWFDEPFNGIDTRVNSSPSALRAFRNGAASSRYSLTRRLLLRAAGRP